MTDELVWLPARVLADLIRSRDVSPVEVAERTLERLGANATLNAFCAVDESAVLAAARNAETAVMSGGDLGVLHGVPVSVKDLLFTKGLRTTGGSTAYSDFVPVVDDIAVERMRDAGAILLGKTTVPVFGYGPDVRGSLHGAARNPWDPDRTAGTSSGGGAAAVAAGLGPLAIGTDGGGSIRVPSSFCGIVGLKPSFGVVPLYPACRDPQFPGFSGWETLEHVGPMARDVEDAALLLDVLAGPDSRDRHSLPRSSDPYLALPEPALQGIRVAYATRFGSHAWADPEVVRAVEEAALTCEALGAEVVNAAPVIDDPGPAFDVIVASEADIPGLRALESRDPAALNPKMKAMMDRGWSFADISDAVRARKTLAIEIARFFGSYDLLLTPTAPVTAPLLSDAVPSSIAGRAVSDARCLSWFTSPFNLSGNPAITVPCSRSTTGMPIGLQIVGDRLGERRLLRAAWAFESQTSSTQMHPPEPIAGLRSDVDGRAVGRQA